MGSVTTVAPEPARMSVNAAPPTSAVPAANWNVANFPHECALLMIFPQFGHDAELCKGSISAGRYASGNALTEPTFCQSQCADNQVPRQCPVHAPDAR